MMQLFIFFYKFFIINQYNIILYINYILNIFIIRPWDVVFNFLFIFFYIIIILSCLGVIFSKNPIHSVFFLILVFLHITFILLLLNVEFLAFLLIIVYLGAIAVLFLFVIMMFNIHILESRDNIIRYIPLVIVLFLIFLEMNYVLDGIFFEWNTLSLDNFYYIYRNWFNLNLSEKNIIVLSIIYNYYIYHFILASLILLVAMIGAILLTLNQNIDLKKQQYYEQNNKNLYNSVSLKRIGTHRMELWQIYFRAEEKYKNYDDIQKMKKWKKKKEEKKKQQENK